MGKPVAAVACQDASDCEVEPLRPSEGAVLAAVESLYADGLRPYGRILKKRLEEKGWEVDGPHLKSLCEATERLRATPEGAGEWSALLTDREPAFVDVYSAKDIYPDSLWAAAKVYFEGMRRGEHSPLPGGRYASAQELASRHLEFLAEYSLGQVCHITQIAIQRKLLGYQGGAIVPYASSTAMEKSIFAQQQIASDNKKSASAGLPVATWAQAQEHVQKLMEAAIDKGTMRVPLSNIKRLFRTLFSLELSETALGYTKLSELLQDTRFQKICSVKLEERGYTVLPAPALVNAGEHPESPNPACGASRPALQLVTVPPPQSESDCCIHLGDGSPQVRRTFIHIELPGSPRRRRSASLPSIRSCTSDEASTCSPCAFEGSEQGLTDGEDGSGSPQERLRFCVDEPLDFDEDDVVAPTMAFVPATPSPWYLNTASYQEPMKQVFCPGEPLDIEDACDEPLDLTIPMTPSPWPCQGFEQTRVVHIANFL